MKRELRPLRNMLANTASLIQSSQQPTLGIATRKDLGHSIELRHDALLALGNTDRIMKDSRLGIMSITLLIRIQLVQLQYISDELLLFRSGLPSSMGVLRGLSKRHVRLLDM